MAYADGPRSGAPVHHCVTGCFELKQSTKQDRNAGTVGTVVQQSFSIDFSFPIYFTRDVFGSRCRVLVDAVTRLEPGQRHRLLFVLDGAVVEQTPSLLAELETYVTGYPRVLELAGEPLIVPGGERCKNDLTETRRLLAQLNACGIDRHSFVVVVGGGAVLDMACFAAALAHRGVRAIRVPTTVLSQCDSGVGVKNGVNLFGKKNFIGTFLPPFAVINDIKLIETLSLRDRVAGVAEAIKVALLRDAAFFAYLENNADALAQGDLEVVAPMIRRSAELHTEHIRGSGDPFELGSARPLDFGHWSAHKLESLTRYRLRHGEAVAIGMALDLTYAASSGYLEPECVERVFTLLQRVGFALWDESLMERDEDGSLSVLTGLREFREHLGGCLHITLISDIGRSFEVTEMDDQLVVDAIHRLGRIHAERSAPTASDDQPNRVVAT